MKPLVDSLLLCLCLMAAPAAMAQASKEVQALHRAMLSAAMDSYSACIVKSAGAANADATTSPESIADDAHAACGTEFGRASDLAIVYIASTVPEHAKLEAAAFATKTMDEYKANVRAGVIKVIVAKRAGQGS